MSLTSGLIAAAIIGAGSAVVCVALLVSAPRGRRARWIGAAVATVAIGLSVAALLAMAAGVSGPAPRLRLAWAVAAGCAAATGLLLTGILALPSLAPTRASRIGHLLNGLTTAASVCYVAWALVIEPAHRNYRDIPVPYEPTADTVVSATPIILGLVALGVLAVLLRAAPTRRRAARVTAPAALVVAATAALPATVRWGSGVPVLVLAVLAAAGWLGVVAGLRTAGSWTVVPSAKPEGPAPSVAPVVVAIAAALGRLASVGSMDNVSVLVAAIIGATLAAQQTLARREIRRYAERIEEREAHFREMAHTDPLTGLANRRGLLRKLYEDAGGPPSVLLAIDLDGFKNVNDIRGHDVGDTVLVEVARRLENGIRSGDLAARLGGDEFALLMWARPEEAGGAAQRLLQELCRPYELSTGAVFLSASIGVADRATATDVPGLLRNADLALRFAKQRGKHRVERYDAAYAQWVSRRTDLEQELRGAIERGELMLAYQPVIALGGPTGSQGRVAGVEALLRWHHPRLGTVPPTEFIPLAEESGLINALGTWVRREACYQLSRWLADGHDLWLAVNVSVRELHLAEYPGQVVDVLQQYKVPAERLVVEVTEHAVALDLEQLSERLTELRAKGVRVALDDFGSGYSSMGQLRTLPVDILKIDRTILAPDEDGSGEDRTPVPLVDVVVQLGRRLGLEVVAEGITRPEQRRLLARAGCTYGQGALLGAPMPAERVEAMFPVRLIPSQDSGSVDSAREMRQS